MDNEELRKKKEESIEPVPGAEDPKAEIQDSRAFIDECLSQMTVSIDNHEIPENKLKRLKDALCAISSYCLHEVKEGEGNTVVVRFTWDIPEIAPLKIGFVAGCRVMLTTNDRHMKIRSAGWRSEPGHAGKAKKDGGE